MDAADAVVINSPHSREFAIKIEGVQPDRIFLIPNGVEVDKYTTPVRRELLRKEMGLQSYECMLGTVGRLTEQKGIDILLLALSVLSKPELKLVIFGNGGDEARLRALSVKLGLESQVHFAGYRRDLSTLLGALDLYVHPARFEGMPNALLEAMAAACPIVATAVDGNRELIADGKHGWLVPSESPTELANAINEALSDPAEAHLRGALARERVREDFSVDSMVAAWEAVLLVERSNSNSKKLAFRYAR